MSEVPQVISVLSPRNFAKLSAAVKKSTPPSTSSSKFIFVSCLTLPESLLPILGEISDEKVSTTLSFSSSFTAPNSIISLTNF